MQSKTEKEGSVVVVKSCTNKTIKFSTAMLKTRVTIKAKQNYMEQIFIKEAHLKNNQITQHFGKWKNQH